MGKSANLFRFFLSSSFNSCKCGLHKLMPKLRLSFVGWPRIHLIGSSVVPEPNTFF